MKKITKTVITDIQLKYENMDIYGLIDDLNTLSKNMSIEYEDDFISGMFKAELKTYLSRNLVPIGVRFKLEENESKTCRLVLNIDRSRANFRIPLIRQCNGAMIVFKNTRPITASLLVLSYNEFSPQSSVDIEQFLRDGLYKIYQVQDGTSINLYYYNNTWVYGTKNAWDIENMIWRNARYGDILDKLFEQYSVDFDRLNPDIVYSIGYSHPDHHPFQRTGKMWLISAYDKKNRTHITPDIGIPIQEPINLVTVKNYTKHLNQECEAALKNYLSTGEVFLGYILRSTDPKAFMFSDILMESTLYAEIKKCIYDMPYTKNYKEKKVSFYNLNHVIISNWLDFSKRQMFIKLFPQFGDIISKLEDSLSKAIDIIMGASNEDMNITILATKLSTLMNKYLDQTTINNKQKLTNLAMNPAYADAFLDILSN